MIRSLTVKHLDIKNELIALITMIDPGIGWFEVAAMKDQTAEAAKKIMDDVWFTQYP